MNTVSSAQHQILDFMRHQKRCRFAEIDKAVPGTETTKRNAVKRLCDDGLLTRDYTRSGCPVFVLDELRRLVNSRPWTPESLAEIAL